MSLFTAFPSMRFKKPKNKFIGKSIKEMYDEYRITKRILGSGQFSQVKLAFDNAGESYAVKIINKDDLSESEINKIVREVKVIQSLIHPNIVRFNGFYEDINGTFIIIFTVLTVAFSYLHRNGARCWR